MRRNGERRWVRMRAMAALAAILCGCHEAPAPAVAPPSGAAGAASAAPSAPPNPESVKEVVVPDNLKALVDAADRSPEDKELDLGRRPGETLAFFGVGPGMKVAELAAGGGYTTELLARAVGPSGVVYGQNSPWLLQRYAEKPWAARLTKPVMKNVVRVDREFDDPLPPEAQNLDVVFDILFYHDTFWLNVDRAKMNSAVFRALKPGGIYAIIDHSGRSGTGSADVQSLHRIEESVVRDEVLKAGFRLAQEADYLRNPADPRDWNDAPKAAAERRGKSDRFVLKFVKP